MNNNLEEYLKEQELQERLEHRDVLLAIAAILKTDSGITLFSYLFKNLEVGELPFQDMEGNILHDRLGFLRAGNSIFKLACEADSKIAASILSKLERRRYEQLCEQHNINTSNE